MRLLSTAFNYNSPLPSVYTCDGKEINPPLTMQDVPDTAKSLVLIVDDPDAPSHVWTHWILWNIPPTTTGIGENSVPKGATQGVATGGTHGYESPCPPSGTHRYVFTLYALDTSLSLPGKATKEEVLSALKNHVVDQTQLIGLYSKRE